MRLRLIQLARWRNAENQYQTHSGSRCRSGFFHKSLFEFALRSPSVSWQMEEPTAPRSGHQITRSNANFYGIHDHELSSLFRIQRRRDELSLFNDVRVGYYAQRHGLLYRESSTSSRILLLLTYEFPHR